ESSFWGVPPVLLAQGWADSDGGIAFLYHPCVHPTLKTGLVALARSCYCNHIITPYPTLSHERPLALAAWGRTLEMSHIDHKEIGKWIPVRKDQKAELRSNNKRRYTYLLIRKSEMLLDKDGNAPCPFGNLTVRQIEVGLQFAVFSQMPDQFISLTLKQKPNSLRWTKQDLGLSGAASKAGSESSGVIQVDSVKESHQIGQQLPLQDGGGNHGSENETGLRREQEKNSGCPHTAAPPRSVHLPTPRTEEAAWAAAALGFLLVILTLAVLHTRLYRGCQRGPSLYWPAQQHEFHEYDSVAEIVKRRLQLGGRRKRKPLKAKKEEHCMLINSSSDDSD
uniref:Tumor protein p53 inducible protein 13 n=1 Tax=Erpetoichthys calabaricus TaxID=27687 RepID=A0A8C4S8M3_ERPCA